MPKADLECLTLIHGFEAYDPVAEVLTMLKPMYGLNDVLHAWRTEFNQVFAQWVSCRQFCSEPELYCVRKGNQQDQKRTIERANEHILE